MVRLASVLASAAAVVAIAAPSVADVRPLPEGDDDRPCVTYAEFNSVRIRMRLPQVRRVFDTPGTRIPRGQLEDEVADFSPDIPLGHGRQEQARSYPVCADPQANIAGGEVLALYLDRWHHLVAITYNDRNIANPKTASGPHAPGRVTSLVAVKTPDCRPWIVRSGRGPADHRLRPDRPT